ncbi:MAG: hypothetical protein HY841_00990 [Bacteroidetes bacterium]|nr:hypothetical protein [Bacteroidota bacterium]
MCNHKTLHHNQHGYIIKCSRCKHIQIGFGSFAVTQTMNDFFEFRQMIYENHTSAKFSHELIPEQKSIQLSTPLRNMFWVFSLNELHHFTDLLEKASISLEIEQILTTTINEN